MGFDRFALGSYHYAEKLTGAVVVGAPDLRSGRLLSDDEAPWGRRSKSLGFPLMGLPASQYGWLRSIPRDYNNWGWEVVLYDQTSHEMALRPAARQDDSRRSR